MGHIVHDNSAGALATNLIWFVSIQKLYKLANGLNNVWSIDTIGAGATYPTFVLFKNPTTGLPTGGYNIAKTTNGGQSWYQVNNTAIGYGCRSFINIPNTDWVFMNGGTSIRISYDFCNTWQTLLNYNSGEQYLSIMDAYDSLSIWLASNKGRLLKYNYGFIGIIKNSNSANSFTLYQNYPNPFNPTTTIRFDIPPLEGESLPAGAPARSQSRLWCRRRST